MINKIKDFFSKKENVVKCAYCCATILSIVSFGLLFAKLIGGEEDIELGNSFEHAFRGGTYNILIMIALLFVIATLTWNIALTILLFIPKTKKYMLVESENEENAKLYAIIHLSIFGVIGIYVCIIFFLSRIIIMKEVDNGILPAAGFLGVFALLSICATGVANCINEYSLFLPKGLEPEPAKKEEKKVAVKKEVKKVEEKKKEEPKKEVKKEKPKVEKKEEPKKEEVKEEEPEEKAVSLKDMLKTAAVKKPAPKKEKVEKKEPKEDEKEEVEEPEVLFNKELMGKTMQESFPKLVYEGRENFTSTGLPLADTCYIKTSKGNKCFMYVYETEGNSLILCKISKDYYKKLKSKKDLIVNKSEFPKSKVAWSSVVLDSNVNKDLVEEIIKEASEFVKNEAETDPTISNTSKPAPKKPQNSGAKASPNKPANKK